MPAKEHALSWIRRPGIGRRIAAAMVLSLLAIQFQGGLQVWLLSEPHLRMTGARWLADQTSSLAAGIFAQPVSDREGKASQSSSLLTVTWSREKPIESSNGPDPTFARLSATVKAALGNNVRSVEVYDAGFSVGGPFRAIKTQVLPASVAPSLGTSPLTSSEPDILVPASLRILVQGDDNTWISVSFAETVGGLSNALPLLPLIGGGLIIALISTLLTRRIVAPLDRLVEAADQIGKTRDFVAVSDQGLYEFGVVARAFEDMQRRLLSFVKERTQMLAAISHDFRSSLMRMRISAEQLETDDDRDAILSEIADMTAMVDTTLAFASGETTEAATQPMDLAALLISLVDEATDNGHDCSYTGPDHLEIVGRLIPLKRAFRNLIDNAVKYGAVARVSLKADREHIEVSISDDGPGIPHDRTEEAMAPFRRLDQARSAKIPGTGLGLTIVRDVVLGQGGSIRFRTKDGSGFTVVILLPK
ncbi:HAMP domain-containing sensor histidine kinase [Bradyrhizobium sp. BR 10289]|uniref:sensor histidine kinase n=1 Tax=Bradyrhizobium sp. BR 10289 TaxID=2749993 RepID=UPI001C64B577|nr:HAMP domain-containing sensor histidine kinase [Bradyrhizobium sp. BR 10289]MBW7971230.1 HAMP domain-containing histidine kinase [Bradyrhizobium sp. BR 10289]